MSKLTSDSLKNIGKVVVDDGTGEHTTDADKLIGILVVDQGEGIPTSDSPKLIGRVKLDTGVAQRTSDSDTILGRVKIDDGTGIKISDSRKVIGTVILQGYAVGPATTYNLSGPSSGVVGVASSPFTVALPAGTSVASPVTVTPSAGAGGGTFSPANVILTTASPSAQFTYTPASSGAKTISVTNDGGLTNPGNLTYTATAAGLADGDPVSTWPDSSGLGNDGLEVGTPIFKVNIVNGKPVVRLILANAAGFNLTAPISGEAPWCMFVVMKASTGSNLSSMVGNASPGMGLGPFITTGNILYIANRAGYAQGVNPSNAFHVYTADCRGDAVVPGVLNIFVDGASQAEIHIASANSGDFSTLGYVGNPVGFGDGDLAEIMLYRPDFAIGISDRANIAASLGDKYGIAITGGTVIDPTTVAGLVGWWKADSLLS